jgi:hypothetical protein
LHVQYIYVDSRLADSLPSLGFYFYPGETSAPRRITVNGVAKFAHVPGLRSVYHIGPVTIYSTAGLGVTPGPARFTGYAAMGLGSVGDFVLGVIVFSLGFCFRRRLGWAVQVARDAGAVGTSVALMGFVILLGAGLFELRAMPGPGFMMGFLASYLVIGSTKFKLRRGISRPLRSVTGSAVLDPVLLFAVLLVLASVAVSIFDAYQVDVVTVQSLLHGMGT